MHLLTEPHHRMAVGSNKILKSFRFATSVSKERLDMHNSTRQILSEQELSVQARQGWRHISNKELRQSQQEIHLGKDGEHGKERKGKCNRKWMKRLWRLGQS